MTPIPDTYEEFQAVQSRRRKRFVFVCGALALLVVAFYGTRRAPTAPEVAVVVEETPSEPFAELPNGVRVEIIGLASKTNPTTWWKPDGSPLDPPPTLNAPTFHISSTGPTAFYRCWLEVHGVDDPGSVAGGMSGISSSERDAVTGEARIMFDGVLMASPQAKTASLDFGFATEPLSPVRILDPQGRRIAPPQGSPEELTLEDIEVQSVSLDSNGVTTKLLCDFPVEWRNPHLTIAAIDAAGTRYDPIRRGAQLDETSLSGRFELSLEFQLLPTQIDHFEYQLRVYRHWVKFENISLEPGHRTTVRREVTSIPRMETAD